MLEVDSFCKLGVASKFILNLYILNTYTYCIILSLSEDYQLCRGPHSTFLFNIITIVGFSYSIS